MTTDPVDAPTPDQPESRPTGSNQPSSDSARPAPQSEHDPLEDSVVDRRSGLDRRRINEHLAKFSDTPSPEDEDQKTLDRRRGAGRRLSDFVKSAEEGEMNKEQFLFLLTIDEFKRANNKAFPSWTDVLEVVRLLGYRKTSACEIPLPPGAEDWREKPDAASGVRDVTNPSDR